MKIVKFETWWCRRQKTLFDPSRMGGSAMDWDVVVLQLTTDTGITGQACALAARSGQVTESLLMDNIASVVLGKDPCNREKIWHDLWNIDRHLVFFPIYLPGPVDVALWDIAAKDAELPLYKYLGGYRSTVPCYASSLFHARTEDYIEEARRYVARGIRAYKAHPPGPESVDREVHRALRQELGSDIILMTDPVAEYTLDQAIRVGRELETLDYRWFEEPFRDFELTKYKQLCKALDIPVAATETTRGAHWGVAQAIAFGGIDIVRADVSWKAGVTGTLKIAHLAEAFGLSCEIHTTTMGLMDIANLHVTCAIRNCEFFELFIPEDDFQFPLKHPLPVSEAGMITVPEAPGLGVELDWDGIDGHCVSYQVKTFG